MRYVETKDGNGIHTQSNARPETVMQWLLPVTPEARKWIFQALTCKNAHPINPTLLWIRLLPQTQ